VTEVATSPTSPVSKMISEGEEGGLCTNQGFLITLLGLSRCGRSPRIRGQPGGRSGTVLSGSGMSGCSPRVGAILSALRSRLNSTQSGRWSETR
jgi:hypothetical protein